MPKPLPLVAAQGDDTEDFLQHIAWTDVIMPKFEADKATLTRRLMQSILQPLNPQEESREQLAGKLFGIEYAIKVITDIVGEGRKAQRSLLQQQQSFFRDDTL